MRYAYYLIRTDAAPAWNTPPPLDYVPPPPPDPEDPDSVLPRWPDPPYGEPANWVQTQLNIYFHAEPDGGPVPAVFERTELAAVNPALIGAWDFNGMQIVPPDLEAYAAIRPLGNHPPRPIYDIGGGITGTTRGGEATKHLQYQNATGALPRQLGSNNALYPDDDAPLAIEIRHKEFGGGWPGWGWRAEFVGPAASRDPSVRAIGVYSDAECTQYQYTTGAFVQGPSDWQVDGEGQPLMVWFTETPPGFAKPAKEAWHLAVLWASVQEGYQTLHPQQTGITYLYWDKTQPSIHTVERTTTRLRATS